MQIGIFDGGKKFVNNKPIRLIELFGGIQAQATALHELGIDFESHRYIDFDKYAVKSANAIYRTDFKPTDITKITASDLEIVNTDKYCYIMTYSFPCQDLSLAGKGAGMEKGSGTRSGLLWEVERLLNETNELPQVLLMENVPEVIGIKNMPHFAEWIKALEKLGYKNYWQNLKATDFGIPQSRNRTFMISLLGNYYYNFPKPIRLKYSLKDLMENEIDEKYYLSDKALQGAINTNFSCGKIENKLPKNGIIPTICARDYKDPKCVAEPFMYNPYNKAEITDIAPTQTTSCGGTNTSATVLFFEPKLKELTKNQSQGNRVYDSDGLSVSLTANGGGRGAKTGLYKVKNLKTQYRIRKLMPLECWKLMGFRKDLFKKAEAVNSNAQLYKQAGNSIVVPVLMAIFGELLNVKWKPKVEKLIINLKGEEV